MKGKVIITDIMMWSDYWVHHKGSYEPVGGFLEAGQPPSDSKAFIH